MATITNTAPPLEQSFGTAPKPTPFTVRLRTFLPWQLVRFAVINLKMFRIIWRNHHQATGGQEAGHRGQGVRRQGAGR